MTRAPADQGKRETYPAYKPSGVEWLGEIPRHWEVNRLKHLCRRSALYGANEPATSYVDDGVRFLRTTDITEHGDLAEEGVCLEPEVVRDYILANGDLLISRSGTIGRAFLYDGRRHGPCAYAGYLVRFVPGPSVFPRFVFYFMKSKSFEQWLSLSVITSTIGNVNGQKYANMHLAHPPLDEQRAIAAFLDRETARIDALIEKKQRQIELLQEKRAALISRAVTKGLDPNAPMKDSGIEWLGEIPKHWSAVSLRRLLRVSSGDMISVNDFCEEGYPVFGGNGFRGYSDRWNTEGDTIIIGRYGALCGNVRVTEERIWATEHAFRVIPLAPFYAKFLAAVIETLDLNRLSARTAQPGLNSEMVRNNVVGIPPISEQKAIADFVASETTRSDRLVSKIEASIAALREFRSALISAAVTGKIDVRGEVA